MEALRTTRRTFLAGAVALAASRRTWSKPLSQRIGITDWNLKKTADPQAIELASHLGFNGVQVSFGRNIEGGKMPLDNPAVIAKYLELSKRFDMPIDGTCVDRLHDNGLKSDRLAPKWVSDAIRLTRDLQTRVLLVPFFGPWAIKTPAEMDYVGDALRELAPEAEKADVLLGIEDTISAEDNVRIMDRSRSKNVLVYYDVGNSTQAGFNIIQEIRWLGKDRICQVHLKDNPHYLGEGSIQFSPVVRALNEIGFDGWANLETDTHPAELQSDLKRNLAYIRSVIQNA